MDNVIEISSLYFSYGNKQVLNNLSLSIPRGKVVCLMGQNGSGKTTLIDIIMGLNKFVEGNIHINDKDIKGLKTIDIAKQIAYVPQIHKITFPYTVKEVVMMGRTAYMGLFGGPKKKDDEIVMNALKMVGIEDYADRPYSQLSGGEIKLVLLARALGQGTDIIVMDEPTAHLDLKNELLFLETVSKIVSEDNKTVLIATHSPEHAFYFERLKTDVEAALMKDGQIYKIGVPSDIITKESIKDVFNVDADIITTTNDDGIEEKTICLRNTINEESK